MSDVPIVYVISDDLVKISSLLPSNINRSIIVHSLVKSLELLSSSRIQILRPILASYKNLSVYHTPTYLDFILDPVNSQDPSTANEKLCSTFGLEDDCPPFPGLPEYVRLVAGATLTATEALRRTPARVAICWDGGRHHALRSQASGFCYVADCVLAILNLGRPPPVTLSLDVTPLAPKKPRVMYLDLDLHFSDGVYQAFRWSNSSNFLHLSIHHASRGFFSSSTPAFLPDTNDPDFNPLMLSLPLNEGASSATFARVWKIVERIKDVFFPDYLVVQCGCDGLAGDSCATWNWCLGEEEGSLGWCIERVITEWSCKTVLLGGGGYNHPNAARAWAYLTSIAIGSKLSLETDIPDHSAFPLYAPSFTLDVPAGNMQDQNGEEYLVEVEGVFNRVVDLLSQRLSEVAMQPL
ncbi:hypothetical protein JAAARDRAFT_67871 [Jaapia argillacea MUCL 33604]|uniref:histone deacetylase n=1 Tax=Jaapia argillacea MUCL 33604 TaxID=933084 RepID=A0A067QCK0_9AGAM|nr:hypothetical protein JAAARDRAFT_67871 [Jaapia argillacea MUCL 33604]